MASRVIDPNLMTPRSTSGDAKTYLEAIDSLIANFNSLNGSDASWVVGAVAAPGAIDPAVRIHALAVDGTDAYTLADGTYLGQEVTAICLVAGANIPVGTITPATRTTGYANVTAFGAAGDFCTFKWTSTGWCPIACAGVTITP